MTSQAVDRPMRDVGGYLAYVLARPLAAIMNWGPGPKTSTAEEVRTHARHRPRTAEEAIFAHVARTFAWLMVGFLPIPIGIPIRFSLPDGPLMQPWLTFFAADFFVSMFAGGVAMIGGARWSLSWAIENWHSRPSGSEFDPLHLDRVGRVTRFVCMPSNIDLVGGLMWAFLLTPIHYNALQSVPL
jgi:hypothetical protein